MRPKASDTNRVPTDEQLRAAKARIIATVSSVVEEKIDYVFLWADYEGEGGHPSWGELGEVGSEISGTILNALDSDLGARVQSVLEHEMGLTPTRAGSDKAVGIPLGSVDPASRRVPQETAKTCFV